MKVTTIKLFAVALFLMCLTHLQAQTMKDIDGNVYKTVQIGTQTWMAENLNVTKYNDGTPIPLVTDSAVWVNLTTPGMCWYNNDKAKYTANKYGALYNWYTINSGKLSPKGWHVPTDADYKTLLNFLGGDSSAIKLRETGSTNWSVSYYNIIATNESGFTALGCGSRSYNGDFIGTNILGSFWTATEKSSEKAWYLRVYYDSTKSYIVGFSKKEGHSIRCIKD